MLTKELNDLFYTCSLIEFIGRQTKNKGTFIVNLLGKDELKHIMTYADVLHCERIEEVADRYIEDFNIKKGTYDNVSRAEGEYPSYWDLGKIYMRLIRDVSKGNLIDTLMEVYNSWITDSIEDYNVAFYYMYPEYIKICYQEGKVLLYQAFIRSC